MNVVVVLMLIILALVDIQLFSYSSRIKKLEKQMEQVKREFRDRGVEI